MIAKIKNLNNNTKFLIAAFISLGIVCYIFDQKPSAEVNLEPEQNADSVDTHIPAGYILAPVELANASTIDSILSEVGGVVDLYLAPTETRKGGLKIARRIKLLRAPKNPDQYAILIAEQEAPQILSYQGPFLAVIQNPKAQGAKVES